MTEQKYAGWLLFNEQKALDHLLAKGVVYTARDFEHKTGWGYAKSGKKLVAKVQIEFVCDLCDKEGALLSGLLESHVEESGFATLEEWKQAILRQHESFADLALYKATVLSRDVASQVKLENKTPKVRVPKEKKRFNGVTYTCDGYIQYWDGGAFVSIKESSDLARALPDRVKKLLPDAKRMQQDLAEYGVSAVEAEEI